MKTEKTKIEESIEIPEGVTATISDSVLTLKGQNGEVSRNFYSERAETSLDSGLITIKAKRNTKKERQITRSFKAHIKNMIKGVFGGYHYTLKVCSGHFPINVSISGREFVVKNFLGEKTARRILLPPGVSVKVNGSDIEVNGPDNEAVGAIAGAIENLTRRTKFDRRVFQDGIIMTSRGQE